MSEIDKLEAGEWFNFGASKIASRNPCTRIQCYS